MPNGQDPPLSVKVFTGYFLRTSMSDFIPKLLGLAASVTLARAFPVDDFVQFATGLAWITVLWMAADLGMGGHAVRTLAPLDDAHRAALLRQFMSVYLVLTFLLTVTGVLLGLALGASLFFFALLPFVVSYGTYPDWFLRATGRLGLLARGSWMVACAQMLVGMVALVGALPPLVVTLLWAVSPLVGSALVWAVISRLDHVDPAPIVRFSEFRAGLTHLRGSIASAAAGLPMQLMMPLALSSFVDSMSAEEGAAYALASRIVGAGAGAVWVLLLNMTRWFQNGETPTEGLLGLAGRAAAVGAVSVGLSFAGWILVIAPLSGITQPGTVIAALGALILIPPYLVKALGQIMLFAKRQDAPRLFLNLTGLVLLVLLLALPVNPAIAYFMAEAAIAIGALSVVTIRLRGRHGATHGTLV